MKKQFKMKPFEIEDGSPDIIGIQETKGGIPDLDGYNRYTNNVEGKSMREFCHDTALYIKIGSPLDTLRGKFSAPDNLNNQYEWPSDDFPNEGRVCLWECNLGTIVSLYPATPTTNRYQARKHFDKNLKDLLIRKRNDQPDKPVLAIMGDLNTTMSDLDVDSPTGQWKGRHYKDCKNE